MEIAIVFFAILLVPCIAFTMINIVYTKYKSNDIKSKLSGFEVARKILDDNDLKNMYIVEVKGSLNDHYDYNQKVIRLSTDIFHGENITAAVVASRLAHYAIYDKKNISLARIKFMINPFMTYVIYLAYIMFILGICVQEFDMIGVSSILLGIVLVFQLVTIGLEYLVNETAIKDLDKLDILNKKEIELGNKVMKVAVFTFVMNILVCVSNLFSELIYNLKK